MSPDQVRCVADGGDFFPVDSSMNSDTCELGGDVSSKYCDMPLIYRRLPYKRFNSSLHITLSPVNFPYNQMLAASCNLLHRIRRPFGRANQIRRACKKLKLIIVFGNRGDDDS